MGRNVHIDRKRNQNRCSSLIDLLYRHGHISRRDSSDRKEPIDHDQQRTKDTKTTLEHRVKQAHRQKTENNVKQEVPWSYIGVSLGILGPEDDPGSSSSSSS